MNFSGGSSTRPYMAVFLVTLGLLAASFVSLTRGAPQMRTGLMIPLYTDPDITWAHLIQSKASYPAVPFVVIINPSNGPGVTQSASYVARIQQMQAVGITVIGYVNTHYGKNPISAVRAEVRNYSLYGVDGIYFDEMPTASGYEPYYRALSLYAKGLGMSLTVGNPGTNILASYMGTVDTLVIYENSGLPSAASVAEESAGYPKDNFAVMAHTVPKPTQAYIQSIANRVGYVFFTDNSFPNPYDSLPSYFASLVAMLNAYLVSTSSLAGAPSDQSSPPTADTSADSDTTPSYAVSSPRIIVTSLDLSGNPIVGMYATVKAGGSIIIRNYTLFTYTATSDVTYVVCVANYQNYVFSHWADGTTSSCIIVTPTQNLILTAYYQT